MRDAAVLTKLLVFRCAAAFKIFMAGFRPAFVEGNIEEISISSVDMTVTTGGD